MALVKKIRLLIFTMCAIYNLPATAQSQPISTSHRLCEQAVDRPCIGLVLGGGGARGSAHIGVIKAIEELNIPIDMIVGTSIGSFVGGLYASGKSPSELETLFSLANWDNGYKDNLGRSEIPNRRKRQLDHFPIQLELGFDGKSIKLPQGFIRGQGMKSLIDEMLGAYPAFKSFDDLPIPFRAVAADATTGDEVILSKGDLATALQTSMSLPGIIRPIEVNNRLLVDGGVANNLPISVARSLGAEVIIAVDIGSPAAGRADLTSSIAILNQLTSFLTSNNVSHQKSLLDENDILIKPSLDGLTLFSFDKSMEGIEGGYIAARNAFSESNVTPKITEMNGIKYSINTQSDAAKSAAQSITIDSISLENHTRLSDRYLIARTNLEPGHSYTTEEIHKGIDRLYGQGTIARINSTVINNNSLNDLNLKVEEKEWGPGYLNFKFTFEDNFKTFSEYQLGASYRLTNISHYGAEWYTAIEFGTEKTIHTELYWPVSTSGFFWDLSATYEREIAEFISEDIGSGQLISSTYRAAGGLGWSSIDLMDVTLNMIDATGSVRIPDNITDTLGIKYLDFDQSGLLFKVNFDTLDHAGFPREGWKLTASLQRTRDEFMDVRGYSTLLDVEFNKVISFNRHSLRGLMRYQSTLNNDPLALIGNFNLGGFLNLSGNPKDSFSGRHLRFTSLIYTYELAENNFGAINLPLYLGLSAEAGNVWTNKDEVDYKDLTTSTSIFVGWNSPLGPAYLAYGISDTSENSLYAFLGVAF